MDFGQFDSRSAGNKGAWMHVTSPIDGKPLYDDGDPKKPCEVLVYGIESEAGIRVLESSRQAMKSQPKDEAILDVAIRAAKETAPLVGGFRNINRGDVPAKSPDDVEWFLSLQIHIIGDHKTFLEQVKDFSMRRENHLKKA